MSFETITIYRDFPIKNDFVQVPPNTPADNSNIDADNAENLVSGSVIVSLGSGKATGSKHGRQRFLRLPGIKPYEWYTTDPVELLQ